MRWNAANIEEQLSINNGKDRTSESENSETVEAALSRLTKAYSTAMACVGTLHKLQKEAENSISPSKLEDLKTQGQKLALAGRRTFERAILLDSLVSKKLAPTFTKTIREVADKDKDDNGTWKFVTERRPDPVRLTSSSHKATVSDIAYLSLLNYADLLVATQGSQHKEGSGILNNGVVEVSSLVTWGGKNDQKLALMALCDAVDIDGSDPVIWLKLACAARRYSLSHVSEKEPLCCRRLERHAIEKGLRALPPNVAPNRLLLKAMKEHEELVDSYTENLHDQVYSESKLVLDLPRYSWSVLGRMLIRTCREAYKPDSREAFGSPSIELRISPVLILPQRSLGKVCTFLHNQEIWKFESTCRGLSAAILSARALLEREESNEKVTGEKPEGTEIEKAKQNDKNDDVQKAMTSPNIPTNLSISDPSTQTDDAVTDSHPPVPSRSSKRVRSQLITSGKRNERETRRSSVKFCVLASTVHCSSDEESFITISKREIDWAKLYTTSLISSLPLSARPIQKSTINIENAADDTRLGTYSLPTFISRWSRNNSGPFHVLERYLVHVALNVAEVFHSDQDSLALSSFVVDCADIVSKKRGPYTGLTVCSYGDVNATTDSEIGCMECFAVNLLIVELRLKRSEGEFPGFGGYETDSNFIGAALPELLELSYNIEKQYPHLSSSKNWISLKTRLHWVLAGFYLERSRLTKSITESRKAEHLGLAQVELTMKSLSMPHTNPVLTIKTPHLMSPRRTGFHWRVLSQNSLSALKNDIEASSVVSSARQNFQENLTQIEANCQTLTNKYLEEKEAENLVNVGETLFRRYDVRYDVDAAKFEELLDDFIACCADYIPDTLDSLRESEVGESKWGSLWFLAPSKSPRIDKIVEVSNPSILTILMTCLNASSSKSKIPIAQLATRLAICSFELLITSERTEKFREEDDGLGYFSENDSLSDDDSIRSMNETQKSAKGSNKNSKGQKANLIAIVAEFLIDKISDIYVYLLDDDEKANYTNGHDLLSLMKVAMLFVTDWYRPRSFRNNSSTLSRPDYNIFVSLCSLKHKISVFAEDSLPHDTQVAFFIGLCRILVTQRKILPQILESGNDSRYGRSAKQKECLGRAELVRAVSSELALLLSVNLSKIDNGSLIASDLIVRTFSPSGCTEENPSKLLALIEALLYFHGLIPDNVMEIGSTLERLFWETLFVPVSSAIVGICGSAISSCSLESTNASKLSLSDFFDSDASANEEEKNEEDSKIERRQQKRLLRPLCQSIQCISLLVENADDKLVARCPAVKACNVSAGNLFPLVVTRVLSSQTDLLLSEFGTFSSRVENLWQEYYPYRTRSIGAIADSALHKVYKLLYGITIQGHWVGPEKDKSYDDKSRPSNQPESTQAAAQLYRCIHRAYSTGRKSVPQAALECVLLALPKAESSKRRQLVEDFLFKKDEESVSPESIMRLAKDDERWKAPFETFYNTTLQLYNRNLNEDPKDEIYLIRRGIARQLALSPLPTMSQVDVDIKGNKVENLHKVTEERSQAAFQEKELTKKFWAIIDHFCYSEPACFQDWLSIAECATLKAELIADRLGLSFGFLKSRNFSIPTGRRRQKGKLLQLNELVDAQERRYRQHKADWIPFIGENLSLYVAHQWSCVKSLEKCAEDVSSRYCEFAKQIVEKRLDNECPEYFETHAWNSIQTMHKDKDYVGWQQAWGGMFIEALRVIALKSSAMAFYLLDKNEKIANLDTEKALLQSEVLESLGVAMYSALRGSQGYGYPMRVICDFQKRKLAEASHVCFFSAAKKVEHDDDQVTYDLFLMTGKSYEKVAKTYALESFMGSKDGICTRRAYNRNMEIALQYYHRSLKEADLLEKEGALPEAQAGGSSHGKLEVLYRLHATRLKCLLSAVQHGEVDREKAQLEALQLTKPYWYVESDSPETFDEKIDINVMQWKTLADIVMALAQCRLDQHFFHRSVYRHAQALMWAPVFHDPLTGYVKGSLCEIPASKSHLLRGHSSTDCAHSAEVIMSSLFDKKRHQLVSVWITSGSSSPSPFEVINSSIRKFDMLRGKYLQAYTEILKLCQRTDTLEALFNTVANSKKDLPSLFQFSVITSNGVTPELSPLKECLFKGNLLHAGGLLKDLKRDLNRALASIILKECHSEGNNGNLLKRAYACYLRLNTTPENIMKTRSWKYNTETLPEVEALCQAYLLRPGNKKSQELKQPSNWSGESKKAIFLKAALEECEKLFPTLKNTLYKRNKLKRTVVNKTDDNEDSSNAPPPPPTTSESKKRSSSGASAESSSVQQFMVDVPPGLEEGEKFETTVKVGSQMKTLRLTVPVGRPSKLKFSLRVPSNADDDDNTTQPPNKRQREDEQDES